MTFNPSEHMEQIKGKDYLKPAWRLVWFRDEHPQGVIITELLQTEPIMVVRASVYAKEGELLATGLGMCVAGTTGKVYSGRELEKAETAAIGRALAHAGYGTQFSEDDGELEDSPIERRPNAASKPAGQPPTQPGSSEAGKQNAASGDVDLSVPYLPNKGLFWPRAYAIARPAKYNDAHTQASVAKLEREGVFTNMSIQEALATFTAHVLKNPPETKQSKIMRNAADNPDEENISDVDFTN